MFTSLNVSTRAVSGVFGDSGGASYYSSNSNIDIYYGDTFFREDARLLKLEDGQNASADITIPVSKLHSVSGALVDAKTGKVINAGKIDITEPGTNDVLTSVEVDADDPSFRLEYVPEGELTTHVSNARMVSRQLVPYPNGSVGTPQYKETLLQAYEPYEAPLIVKTDMQAVNLPLTAKTDKPHP